MRSWIVVALGALAATIIASCVFVRGMPLTPAGLVPFVAANWWAISVLWFGSYGIAAGILAAVAVLVRDEGLRGRSFAISAHAGRLGPAPDASLAPVRAYLVELVVVQFATSVVVLIALGIWQLRESGALWPPVAAELFASLALKAVVVLVASGLLGLCMVLVTKQWLGIGRRRHSNAERPELQLLRQIVELLRAERSASQNAATIGEARIVTALEQGQRSTLEAIKDLATAVNRLNRGLEKMERELREALSLREESLTPLEVGPASAELSFELRQTVAALNAAVTTLQTAASPAATSQALVPYRPRGHVSTELDKLLRDLAEDHPADMDDPSAAADRP